MYASLPTAKGCTRHALQFVIHKTIRCVMLNGRLYDAATMNEVGAKERKRVPFYWEGGMDPGAATTESNLD